jgi:hypothetical protein
MELEKIEKEVLRLTMDERWRLVQRLLQSLQEDARKEKRQEKPSEAVDKRVYSPWLQSLLGCISSDSLSDKEAYVSHLEEKYR